MYREIIELNDRDDDQPSPSWARLTILEILMEMTSIVSVMICFILLFFYWGRVRNEIPVYFIYGAPMAYFSKSYLIILPVASLVLWALMSAYAVIIQRGIALKLRAQNFARLQYITDRFYLGLIKMEIMIAFTFMQNLIISRAINGFTAQNYIGPIIIVVLVATLGRYITKRAKVS